MIIIYSNNGVVVVGYNKRLINIGFYNKSLVKKALVDIILECL